MRRGCIAAGEVICDGCGRTIKHPQRYLLMSEGDGEEEKTLRYCVDCCLNRGYAQYKKMDKGEEVLTFFTEQM